MNYRTTGAYVEHPDLIGGAGVERFPPSCISSAPYLSSGVPEGYQTVLGWLAENNPEALDLLYDPIMDTHVDDRWLLKQARLRGYTTAQVQASQVERLAGIMGVTAYPLTLILERLD